MESFVWQPGWEHTRPWSSVLEAGGRCPGRVPLVMGALLRPSIRRRRSGGSDDLADRPERAVDPAATRLPGGRRGLAQDGVDPLEQVRRDLVAPALGPQHGLQPALELRAVGAVPTRAEMFVDLGVRRHIELPVEIELDLRQDLAAVNRTQGLSPVPSPTTPSPALFFPGAAGTSRSRWGCPGSRRSPCRRTPRRRQAARPVGTPPATPRGPSGRPRPACCG